MRVSGASNVVLTAGMLSFTLAHMSGQPVPKPSNPWWQETQIIVEPRLPESGVSNRERVP